MSSEKSLIGRKALITLVLRTLKSITGRTKLQKTLYLANLCGWDVIPDYKYHFYGPYSEKVNMEIENLRNNGWIEESIYSPSEDNVVYSYSLSRRIGREIADSLASRYDTRLVKRTMGLIKNLNSFSSDDLEIMATLVFLKEEKRNMTEDELVQEVAHLKPRFDTKQIKKNLRVFNILKNFRN